MESLHRSFMDGIAEPAALAGKTGLTAGGLCLLLRTASEMYVQSERR